MGAITEQEADRYQKLYEKAQAFLPRPEPVSPKKFKAAGPITVKVDKSSLRPRWEWELLRVCGALSRQLVLPPEARGSFIGACFSTVVRHALVVYGIPGDTSHLLTPVREKYPRLFNDPRSIEAGQAALAGKRMGICLAQSGFNGDVYRNGLNQYYEDLAAAKRSARSAQEETPVTVGELIQLPRLAAAVGQWR